MNELYRILHILKLLFLGLILLVTFIPFYLIADLIDELFNLWFYLVKKYNKFVNYVADEFKFLGY